MANSSGPACCGRVRGIRVRQSKRLRRIAALLLCQAAITSAAGAATLTVTSASDSGAGTLRAAIAQANITPGRDTIVFGQALLDAEATIVLDSAIGPLAITESVDILAPGYARITLDASGVPRALSASSPPTTVSMRLTGLRIVGAEDVAVRIDEGGVFGAGILRVSDSEFVGNRSALEGGRVDVRNSRFTGNGAAIKAVRLALRNSSFVNNGTALYTDPDPGTIFVAPGPIINAGYAWIRNSMFSGNDYDIGTSSPVVALGDGVVSGSRFVGNPEQLLSIGSGTIRRSVFVGGRAYDGGAIDAERVQVLDSYFGHNIASSQGGALDVEWSALVVNSTFVRNRSEQTDGLHGGGGGAINAIGANLEILNSSFSRNESVLAGSAVNSLSGLGDSGELLVRNSVFELNAAGGSGREIAVAAGSADLPGSSHNVFSDASNPLFIDGVNHNRVVAGASLGPVAVQDDSPPFLPPQPASGLADAGTTLDLAHYGIVQDARGRNRISGAGVDIGAVETDGATVGFFNQSFESGGFRPGGSCETLTPGVSRMGTTTTQGAAVTGLASMFGAWPPEPGTFVDLRLEKDRFVSIPLDVPAGTSFALEVGPVPGPPPQQPSGSVVAAASDCIGAPGTLHAAPTFETYDVCEMSTGMQALFNQEGANTYPQVYCDLEGIRSPMFNLMASLPPGSDCPAGGCLVRITFR